MKRKTNLFYLDDAHSKFLTFSNYTESLTENYLSIDTNLYPSRFLCLNIPTLTSSTKNELIRYLCGYYENKLAFLRDQTSVNQTDPDMITIKNEDIHPLNLLFNAIYKFVHAQNTTLEFDECGFDITNICTISETNYEGSYSDIICIIDGSESYTTGKLNIPNTSVIKKMPYDKGFVRNSIGGIEEAGSSLYNWSEYNSLPNPYNWKSVNPANMPIDAIYDESDGSTNNYYTNDLFTELELEEKTGDIKFNVLIPLFDVRNSNDYSLNEDIDLIENISSNELNIPLGIWFADELITLKRDKSNYCPSWSLTIATQFKPFPYAKEIPSELSEENIETSFLTFSKILYKQNELLNHINKFQDQIVKISNSVNELSARINNIATYDTIDSLKTDMIKLENNLNTKVKEVSDKLDNYVSELNWNVNK